VLTYPEEKRVYNIKQAESKHNSSNRCQWHWCQRS